METDWSPEALLAAVQAHVRFLGEEARTPCRSVLDGRDVLVVFRWGDDPQEYAVRFITGDAPASPWTGEACDSPEEWAHDVAWAVTEEVDTGLVERARRTPLPRGVVELDLLRCDPAYRPPPDGALPHDARVRVVRG